MPYINQKAREELEDTVNTTMDGPGELNYRITRLLDEYIIQGKKDYQHINDCLGALEGAKLEFYRRVVVPYEAEKLLDNGDVYSRETLA